MQGLKSSLINKFCLILAIRGNPCLKGITKVPWEFEEIIPGDVILNKLIFNILVTDA